jgi:hypothetical protein
MEVAQTVLEETDNRLGHQESLMVGQLCEMFARTLLGAHKTV